MALSSISGGENFKKFLANVKRKKSKLDIGFFPEAIYVDGTQVAQVAFDMEFGKINTGIDAEIYGEVIPARSFMQKTFDEKKQSWLEELKTIINNQADKIDTNLALRKVGIVAKYDIRDTIRWWAELGEPRNGPKVKKLKGFDSPLIWTGKLLDSVDYVVTETLVRQGEKREVSRSGGRW